MGLYRLSEKDISVSAGEGGRSERRKQKRTANTEERRYTDQLLNRSDLPFGYTRRERMKWVGLDVGVEIRKWVLV